MKLNKKGFSLVELVVGTAILSVIGLTVAMFLNTGTNMYRVAHRSSTVLFKSIVATNQIQRVVVDSKYPFAVYENDTDHVIMVGGEEEKADGTKQKVIYRYEFDASNQMINLYVDKINDDSNTITDGDPVPFCHNVAEVHYDPQFNAETNETYALKFSILLSKFGLDYNRNEVVSLRNRPVLVRGASKSETRELLAEKLGA